MIDAQDRQAALEGISPPGAGGGEGVHEIAGELAVDDVRGRGIEVAAEDRRRVGKFRGLLEHLAGERELFLAEDAVVPVADPGGLAPQLEIGGGGAEVDVHDFHFRVIGEAQRDLLVALVRVPDLALDFPAGDEPVGVVGAVVAAAGVKHIRDLADLMRLDVLQQDDVRLPGGEVFGGISIVEERAVQGDHADDRLPLVQLGAAGPRRGFSEIRQYPRLVRADQQGHRPHRGDDERKGRAQEKEGRAGHHQADAAPQPDRHHREGREPVRLPREAVNREGMQQQGGSHEKPSEAAADRGHGGVEDWIFGI